VRMLRLGLAATLFAVAFPPAGAAAPVPGLSAVSGASPLARSCEGKTVQRGSEVEPSLAADPADGRLLVAAWQQDRYSVGGGAAALGVAFSRDGGASWARAAVPGMTDCRGVHGRISDPWLSWGPDGSVYLVSAAGRLSSRHGLRTGVEVAVSHDGGASWAAPTTLQAAIGPFNDKPSVTAEPRRRGHAYAVWSQLTRILMSRTSDGGATWSAPVAIASGQLLNVSTISVLRDGTLLHAFFAAGRTTERLMTSRSEDGGGTWAPAVRVANVDDAQARDRRSGLVARSSPIAAPGAVGAPDGSAYAAFATAEPRGLPRVMVARSADGGRSWGRARVAIGGSSAVFTPALAVSPAAGVAVTAYRFRSGGRADAVAALSADRARTWRLRRLTPPFSLRRAPQTQGGDRFLGDYTGLVPAAGGGFVAALALAPPLAGAPSDVFATALPAP
jgi:hypothetical protein